MLLAQDVTNWIDKLAEQNTLLWIRVAELEDVLELCWVLANAFAEDYKDKQFMDLKTNKPWTPQELCERINVLLQTQNNGN